MESIEYNRIFTFSFSLTLDGFKMVVEEEEQGVRVVRGTLAAVHLAAAAEVLDLARRAGLDLRQFADIVLGAAGNSAQFEAHRRHWTEGVALGDDVASSLVRQVREVRRAMRDRKDCALRLAPVAEDILSEASTWSSDDAPPPPSAEPTFSITDKLESDGHSMHVTVIGLGNIGRGMARSLLRSVSREGGGVVSVSGFDLATNLVAEFHEEAGTAPPTSMRESIAGHDSASGAARVVVLTLVNQQQCEAVAFQGDDCLLNLLGEGDAVVLCSTVAASFARSAAAKFAERGICFVDCPVSGGTARALAGDLTMIASGDPASLLLAWPVLSSCGGGGSCVHVLGSVGMGQTAKCAHQLLAGVHIVAAADGLALAEAMGLDVRAVHSAIGAPADAGYSWMFADRGERMVQSVESGSPPVCNSMIDIIVKDLGILIAEADQLPLRPAVPLARAALAVFLEAKSRGLGRIDDSQAIQMYRSPDP